jgi:putative peptidoglycan lipid II flippase
VVGVSLALAAPYFGIPAIVGMAWGSLVGGALQLLVQAPLLRRVGFKPQWVMDWRDPGLLRVGALMLPAVVGLSATQINLFINTFYAASCPEGSISWLNYAYRLFHLPMGLFGVALMVATLPLVSRHAARQDMPAVRQSLASSLTLSLLVTLPAASGLIFLAEPIIGLIYQYGRFTAADTAQTAAALSLYALGLAPFAGVKIMAPVFYALNNTRVPVMGSFLAVAANLLFINLTLAPLQHRAIALATSGSMLVNCLFLGVVLYRRLDGFGVAGLLKSLAKVMAASLVMGLVVHQAHGALAGWLGAGVLSRVLSVLGAVLLGMGLYAALALLLGIPEFKELTRQLRQRFSGAG